MTVATTDRWLSLGKGLPKLPERLLLAHGRGEVLFLAGAGVSRSAGLPDFRELVLHVYKKLDPPVHEILTQLKCRTCEPWQPCACPTAARSNLTAGQTAEVRRFRLREYDVVLGMLERRLDAPGRGGSSVRAEVEQVLRSTDPAPQPIHHNLIRLADRGPAAAIVTTNFDRLLDIAYEARFSRHATHSLGAIPRPRPQPEFAGVLHIHGVISEVADQASEFILTEQDFADFYVRRTVVPDFVYDAARIFSLVLVGYSANDPPMQTLLNAVAADATRFQDIRERYVFLDTTNHDRVAMEDWKARGLSPIPYDPVDCHAALHQTIDRWATLSAIVADEGAVDCEVRRLVASPWAETDSAQRDLFEHIVRREGTRERQRLSRLVSDSDADLGWLNAIVRVCKEKGSRQET